MPRSPPNPRQAPRRRSSDDACVASSARQQGGEGTPPGPERTARQGWVVERESVAAMVGVPHRHRHRRDRVGTAPRRQGPQTAQGPRWMWHVCVLRLYSRAKHKIDPRAARPNVKENKSNIIRTRYSAETTRTHNDKVCTARAPRTAASNRHRAAHSGPTRGLLSSRVNVNVIGKATKSRSVQ